MGGHRVLARLAKI